MCTLYLMCYQFFLPFMFFLKLLVCFVDTIMNAVSSVLQVWLSSTMSMCKWVWFQNVVPLHPVPPWQPAKSEYVHNLWKSNILKSIVSMHTCNFITLNIGHIIIAVLQRAVAYWLYKHRCSYLASLEGFQACNSDIIDAKYTCSKISSLMEFVKFRIFPDPVTHDVCTCTWLHDIRMWHTCTCT